MGQVGRRPSLSVDELRQAVRTYATDSPSVLAEKLEVSEVTIWKYRKQISDEEIQQILGEVAEENLKPSEIVFEAFIQLPAIREFDQSLTRKQISQSFQREVLRGIYRVCCLTKKRPEKLTLDHVAKLLDGRRRKGEPINWLIIASREFFARRGVSESLMTEKGISITQVLGKFAGVKLTSPQRQKFIQTLAQITHNDPKWIALPYFMFYTGTRIEASLNALIENIDSSWETITVYDKAKRKLHPEGKKWKKWIPEELKQKLKKAIGNRPNGKIFWGYKIF